MSILLFSTKTSSSALVNCPWSSFVFVSRGITPDQQQHQENDHATMATSFRETFTSSSSYVFDIDFCDQILGRKRSMRSKILTLLCNSSHQFNKTHPALCCLNQVFNNLRFAIIFANFMNSNIFHHYFSTPTFYSNRMNFRKYAIFDRFGVRR